MSSSSYNSQDLPMSAHHIRRSLFVFGIKIGFLLLFYFIAATVLTFLTFSYFLLPTTASTLTQIPFSLSFFSVYMIVQGVLFIIALLVVTLLILSWSAESAYLSATHLITYRGLFTLDEDIYELDHIKAVKLHQSFLGKIFHYGNLKVLFASSGYHEEITLKNLANPKLYERALKEHVEKPAH